MIVDVSRIRDRATLARVYSELRKTSITFYKEDNNNLKFYVPQNCFVLRYYTDPKFLYARIKEVGGFSSDKLKGKDGDALLKALSFCIMNTFGHSNKAICYTMGVASNTDGLVQYYRDRLKDMMKKNAATVFLYEKIMTILEKDRENLEDELCE